MFRKLASFSVLSVAVLSSIATSPAPWSVHAQDSGKFKVDRGDALEFGIELFATAEALPAVGEGFAPQGGSGEGGLQTELDVELQVSTVGTLGTNRVDTVVTAELWMETQEGDWLVDEQEFEVIGGEPVDLILFADGVFSGCEPGADCERSLSVVLTQTEDAKLKVKFDTKARVRAPLMGPAPKTAELEVEVGAL